MQKAGAAKTNIVWIAGNNLLKKDDFHRIGLFFEAFLVMPLG